jgi:hypothetical protein
MKNYQIVKYCEDLEKEFFNFCKEQSKLKDPASVNMWNDLWDEQENTLPYILNKTDTFNANNGEFHVVFDNDKIIACGGVYKSKSISFAGSRLWVDPAYRNYHIPRNIILPEHKKWSIDNSCKAVAICFNDYNKNLIETFKRTRLGEESSRITSRQPEHLFYSNFHQVDFPVMIRETKQWIAYEKLDESWNYDWSKISYQPT